MHGRKCFVLSALLTATLAGCSSNTLMKPDCHSCTVEEQVWNEFSWSSLEGKWKGSVENTRNDKDHSKKSKTEKNAELSFMKASAFGACASLPPEAIVLNGLLWEQGSDTATREFEAFLPAEDGKVAYGRVTVNKVNGKDICQFRRMGRVMGKNRMNLPIVSFSGRGSAEGRSPASAGTEPAKDQSISFEFLRFATMDKPVAFTADGRKPASVKDQERPALMFRVFKISTVPTGRHEWAGTEEYIYRLWKTQ